MFFEDKTFWIIAVLVIVVVYMGFIMKKRRNDKRATPSDFKKV